MAKSGQSRWSGKATNVSILASILVAGLVATGLVIDGFSSQATANATEHKVFVAEHTSIRAAGADLSERMAVLETIVELVTRVDKNVTILVERPSPAPHSPSSDR